jgi:hypothetical protein
MNSGKVNVMVDIETLDTERTAAILSIGACTMVPFTDTLTFYEEIMIVGQEARTQSQSTLDWWKTQSNYPGGGIRTLPAVLTSFSRYLSSLRAEPIIWCKGTDFDTAILAHAFKQLEMEVPWKYSAVRDFRTLKKLFPVPAVPNPNAHHALGDALHQAAELRELAVKYSFVLES